MKILQINSHYNQGGAARIVACIHDLRRTISGCISSISAISLFAAFLFHQPFNPVIRHNNADKYTSYFLSMQMTEETKKSFFGKYPCVTIRNGIDAEHTFYPRDKAECRKKYGFTMQDKLVLGMAAGFSDERKGAKFLIGSAKAMENEAKFILVGWEEKNNSLLEGISNVITVPNTKDTDKRLFAICRWRL